MDDGKGNWMETIRKEVHSLLGVLTPRETKALRALARELAILKKKPKGVRVRRPVEKAVEILS
jgi:hypothetical protein